MNQTLDRWSAMMRRYSQHGSLSRKNTARRWVVKPQLEGESFDHMENTGAAL